MANTDIQTAYDQWLADPTPARMAATLKTMNPMLVSEIQRYPGPKNVLHSKAKSLAVGAIHSYDPASGAKLSSWVTTQLQPLNRYGRAVSGSVRVPEVAMRQAAEVESRRMELIERLGDEPTDEQLADEMGISASRIGQLRKMVRPVMTEGSLEDSLGDGGDDAPGSPGVLSTGTDSGLRTATDVVYGELDARDRKIFDLKTGYAGSTVLDNNTIAKRLGVSPALVSQRGLSIANRIKEVYRRVQ